MPDLPEVTIPSDNGDVPAPQEAVAVVDPKAKTANGLSLEDMDVYRSLCQVNPKTPIHVIRKKYGVNLTPQQVQAVMLLGNLNLQKLTKEQVADIVGVSRFAIFRWLHDETFLDAVYKESMIYFKRTAPKVLAALTRGAVKGRNIKFIETWLRQAGKLVGEDRHVIHTNKVLMGYPQDKIDAMRREAESYEDAEYVEIKEEKDSATGSKSQGGERAVTRIEVQEGNA